MPSNFRVYLATPLGFELRITPPKGVDSGVIEVSVTVCAASMLRCDFPPAVAYLCLVRDCWPLVAQVCSLQAGRSPSGFALPAPL